MLHLPSVRGRVLDRVRAYAERELGLNLRASGLSYNLLTRSIALRDVAIGSTSAADALLTADRVVVVLDAGLLRGHVAPARISLTSPRLTLVRYADGTMNLPASRENAGPSSPLELGVVSVTGLSIRIDDRLARRSFAIGPFDLSVDTSSTSNRPGAFGPGPFTAGAGEFQTSGTLAGRIGFDGSRVRIEELTVETKEGRAALTGWADAIGEQPAVSAHVTAAIDIPQAARLARIDARGLGGRVDATADVSGALADPAIALTIVSRDASLEPIGALRVAGRSSLGGSRALIENVDVQSAAGSLQLQGAIELSETAPRGATPPSRLALRWTDARLDDLARASGQSLPIRIGSLASGSGTVEFDVRDLRARAWSRARVTATTTLQPAAAVSGPRSLALSGKADLQAAEGRWSLRHSLQARQTQVDLEGTVAGTLTDGGDVLRSTIGGGTRVRVPDLAAVPPLLQDAGVSLSPDVSDGLGGSVLATADLAGTIGRPLARIALEARDLRVRALPHAMAVDARFDADSKGLRAQHLQATAGTMSLVGSGTYGWSGPFDARFELNDANVSELAGRYGVPVSVSGSARLEGTATGHISGSTRVGRAEVVLTSRDLAVEQVAIGPLTARGSLPLQDGGVMTVDAAAPGVGLRGRFEIVNRTDYPVSGELTLDHDAIGTLIPARYREQVGELSGSLSMTAHGSGRLSDPAGIRGRLDLRRLDVVARGMPVRLTAPASITVADDDRIAAESVDLRVGGRVRVTLAGQLGVTTVRDPLRIHLDGPIAELIDIGSRAAGITPVAVRGDGTAALDVTVDGTLARPLPAGTLSVHSSSLEYGTLAPITGVTLTAAIDPTLITVQSVAAGWQGAALTGSGTLPWRVVLASLAPPGRATLQSSRLGGWLNALPAEPARARATLRADNLTPALLQAVLSAEQLEAMNGNASATIAADADRLSLEGVQATAVLERVSLTLAGVPFTQSVPTRLRLEKGRARIEDFRWNAEGNSIVASGSADLTSAQPTLDLAVAGDLDLRVAGAFITGVATGGTANADLRIAGPLNDPDIAGRVTIADGELQLDSPRLAATDFKGTLQIGAGRSVAVSLAGSINTGDATLEGTIGLADFAAPLGKLQLVGRNIALEYPSGFQTESDVNLELALAGPGSTLTGRIDVVDGTYREALVISTQLLNLSSASGITSTAPPAGWLSRLRFDVAVATGRDVQIDNNYGRFDVAASLRVVGTAASPGVTGRLQAADGGEIYLGGLTYQIERLSIDLANPRAITPEVNFSAQTRVADVPIGLDLRCPAAGPCERKVTSLSSRYTDAEAEARLFGTGGGAASAGEGLARLVSGEFLGVVGRTVGLDAIRLEAGAEHRDIFEDPTLISGDVDPAARLTLAKRLGPNVELVYSQNLAEDGFTWITSYVGPRGLSWRVLLLDDQSRSYEFRHEPIGAKTKPRARPAGPEILSVMIAGEPGFPEKDLRGRLKLTEGDRFAFGAWQRDRDRLERFYRAEGFLEARIRARRLIDIPDIPDPAAPADGVGLEYRITRGPATTLAVRGVTLPDDVRDRIQERWASALFDGFLEKDARTIVRDHVYRQGYLGATVATSITQDASHQLKTLTIDVTPGAVVQSRIETTGNAAIPAEQLLGLVNAQDPLAAWLDPGSVERLLENHYRAEGYLAADVSVSKPEIRDGVSVATIKVIEGASYSIGTLELTGLPDLADRNLREAVTFKSGDRYRPAGVAESIDRLEASLREAAYRQASADVDTRVDAEAARVDVAVRVNPGPRSILRDVVVQGADAEKAVVGRSIRLTPDAPLDLAALRETRRRLYDLDLYRSVDIEVQPVVSSAPAPTGGTAVEQPVIATIRLEERQRYRFRYGLAVSDEEIGPDERDRRLGLAADFDNRNLMGRGLSAGLSARWRRDQQVGRATLGARQLFGHPIRSTLFVERSREQLNPEAASPITSDITSFTGEQAYRVQRQVELRYGYGIERNHTFIRDDPSSPFDLTVKIARFTTSGLVDRRDDPFNPARGWFAASSLEYSTEGIGSDLKFLKNFAQYSHFVSAGRGLVVASAARFGVARTFGDEVLIPSERFYAGGANSVRGYREDDLGARSILDDAEGGSALVVLNGELRFPIYRWLKGVGFVDVGNVYPKVSEITFGDLQVGVGAGARFDTPFGLIRFDLGVPANPRPFDPKWRFHIGLGHAF